MAYIPYTADAAPQASVITKDEPVLVAPQKIEPAQDNKYVPYAGAEITPGSELSAKEVPMLSEMPKQSLFKEFSDKLLRSQVSPARAANILALAENKNMSPIDVMDNYDEVTKDLRDQPTPKEFFTGLGQMALVGSLVGAPIATLSALVPFVGLNEAKNIVVAKTQGDEYKLGESRHVSEFLPESAPDRVSDAMDVLEFIGLVAASHGASAGVSNSVWWRNLTNKQRGVTVLEGANNAKATGRTVGEEIRETLKAKGGIKSAEGAAYFKRMQDIHTRGRSAYSEVIAEDAVIQSEFTGVPKASQVKAYNKIFDSLSKAEQTRLMQKNGSKAGLDFTTTGKAKVQAPLPVTPDLVVDSDLNVSQLNGMKNLAQALNVNKTNTIAQGQTLETIKPIDTFTPEEVAQLTDLGLKFRTEEQIALMSKRAKTPDEEKAVNIWANFARQHLIDKSVNPTQFELDLTKRSSKTVFEMFGDFETFSKNITDADGVMIRSRVKGAKKEAYRNILNELKAVYKDATVAGKTVEEFLVEANRATPGQAQIVSRYMDEVITPLPDEAGFAVKKPGKITGDAKNVEKFFEESRKAKLDKRKKMFREGLFEVQRAITDRTIKVTHALEAANDIKAQQALRRFNLIAGATPAASEYYKKAWPNIFGSLNNKETNVLENLIHVKKELSIRERKAGRAGVPTADYEAWLANLEGTSGLSSERLGVVMESAETYFGTMRDLLNKKRNEGIVSEELYNILADNQYSPTTWLKAEALYDQAMASGKVFSGGKPVTSLEDLERLVSKERTPTAGRAQVKTSGIHKLKQGEIDDFQDLDAQNALAAISNETYSRIFKNRATSTLADYARNGLDENGTVLKAGIRKWHVDEQGNLYPSYKSPPKGYRPLSYFESGQRKELWARGDFAEQWDAGGTDINNAMLTVLHHASGASTVRAMATGVGSPLFGLTKGLLMDIPYSYFTLQKVNDMGKVTSLYPINPYKFTKAILSNMKEVAGDVAYQKGEFLAMAEEGGLFGTIGQVTQAKAKKTGDLGRGIGYLNDLGNFVNTRAEYLVRMANRREYIKQGYEPWEATAMVRDSLDYNQGGTFVKIADRVLPYTNVAVQTTRKAGKAAFKNPKEAGYKVAWMAGVAGSIAVTNYIFNPDAIRQESDFNRENNYIIPSGWSFTDDRGNTRHVNIKLKKEPVIAPYLTMSEMMVARAFGDEFEFDRLAKALARSGAPVGSLPNIPLQSAFNTLAYKKNSWNFKDIWPGAPAGKEEWNAQRTSKLWHDLGGVLNFSPEVLKSSVEQIITHEALPQRVVENTYDYIFNNIEQREQDTIMADFFLSNWRPSFVSVTSETTQLREGIEEAEEEAQGKKQMANRFIDSYGYKYFQKDLSEEERTETLKTVTDKFREYKLDKQERDRLRQRFKDYGRTVAYPHQSTWMMFGGIADAKVRGVRVAKWRATQSLDEQREIDVRMNRLATTKSGIIPQDRGGLFWKTFRREVAKINAEK